MDDPVDLAEIADGAFFKRRGDVGQRAMGGQYRADHAFARAPLDPGEVAQVAAGIEVEGGNALLAHQALGLGDACLVFIEVNGLHARSHVRQASQRLFRSFATYTHCHRVLPSDVAPAEI